MCNVETTSKPLAPEDIRVDDYLAVSSFVIEIPGFLLCGDVPMAKPDEMIRMSCLPCDASEPMRVVSVCLPFVFVRRPDGGYATLDTRRHRLSRLDAAYGRRVFRKLKKSIRARSTGGAPMEDEPD